MADNQELDILNMSDEDLAKLDPSQLAQASSTAPSDNEDPADDNEPSNDGDDELPDPTDDDEGKDTDTDPSDDSKDTKDSDDDSEPSDSKTSDEKDTSQADDKKTSDDQKTTESTEQVDYKAVYDKLTAPFKANGRDIQVKSVDDAIALMQMGANYNKKMAALKPNLKLMKMLESNGLLNESKLSFLIDLEKKNPDAISKLVKESGIDPLDIDADKASGYKPNSYTVDDREIELDQVLDSIQDTESYSRTLDIVSNKWDGSSKQVIAKTPQLLKVINDHVSSGIYDLIAKEIESERMFGRLDGLSDLEAYRQVGDAIQARGGFNHIGANVKNDPAPVFVAPKPKKADEDKIREKKRAASSSKTTGSTSVKADYDPLNMSDDEFNKLVQSKYL